MNKKVLLGDNGKNLTIKSLILAGKSGLDEIAKTIASGVNDGLVDSLIIDSYFTRLEYIAKKVKANILSETTVSVSNADNDLPLYGTKYALRPSGTVYDYSNSPVIVQAEIDLSEMKSIAKTTKNAQEIFDKDGVSLGFIMPALKMQGESIFREITK